MALSVSDRKAPVLPHSSLATQMSITLFIVSDFWTYCDSLCLKHAGGNGEAKGAPCGKTCYIATCHAWLMSLAKGLSPCVGLSEKSEGTHSTPTHLPIASNESIDLHQEPVESTGERKSM